MISLKCERHSKLPCIMIDTRLNSKMRLVCTKCISFAGLSVNDLIDLTYINEYNKDNPVFSTKNIKFQSQLLDMINKSR